MYLIHRFISTLFLLEMQHHPLLWMDAQPQTNSKRFFCDEKGSSLHTEDGSHCEHMSHPGCKFPLLSIKGSGPNSLHKISRNHLSERFSHSDPTLSTGLQDLPIDTHVL